MLPLDKVKLMCNNKGVMEEDFVDLKNTYRKTYRMQATGAGGNTIRTSVPSEIVEKAARMQNMTVDEFIIHFRVEWLFNGFEGAWARFVPKG